MLSTWIIPMNNPMQAILEEAFSDCKATTNERLGAGLKDTCAVNTPSSSSCLIEEGSEASSSTSASSPVGLEFRVLRKIGHDALLVSWTTVESQDSPQQVSGYEVRQKYLRRLRLIVAFFWWIVVHFYG